MSLSCGIRITLSKQFQMTDAAPQEKKRSYLVWIIVILILGMAGLGWYFNQEKVKAQELSAEKEQLTDELQALMSQYDNLELANDSLMDVAEAERTKMRKMIDSVQSLRNIDKGQIDRLKRQVYRLQIEKKEMITQLDSMSVHIQKLEKEKELAELTLEIERERSSTLERKSQSLEQTVAKGSILTATSVSAHAIKRWNSGKESDTERARRADEIKVCFTIGKNMIAEKGERTIYVRVMTPENTILSITDSASANSFNVNGQEMLYSASRVIWYEGEAMDECLYVSREDFTKGRYQVEVFTEGYMLGNESFELR